MVNNSKIEKRNDERRCGNSTRLADKYIQALFKKGTCVIKDHLDNSRSHLYLFEKIKNRIEIEHYRFTLRRNPLIPFCYDLVLKQKYK